ncbi:MAG TPA: sigma-54 dependent transcriptional regulator [Candidatus Deferrimicrobium sp.]|nr:sigma-54 dependent transcriptional regulator [Candidatus Deferrimicrobium sp.]
MEDAKILVIDDEKNILESIKMVLTYENYPVATTNNGLDGIDLYKQLKPDIVLLDVKMPGFNGLDVLKQLKDINEFSEIIMISGHSGIEEALEAAKLGAFDFLEKPISRDKLILTVRNAMEKVNLLKENFNLKNVSERKYELIGDAPAMQELRQTIRKVAKTNSTVLITGESGTGKELIARNIYILSSRKSQPFVQVNCAAIPEELIESELFGHEKGSFTGAYEKKIGKFDRAHKGSIFLDEVGDLSLKAQAKVLRVLEEGEIQRVGSEEIKKIDVRVITATNKNLKEEIKKGAFREDLFFRLNVVPVHSPALRERKEDIPQLVEHFITYFSEENNLKRKKFSEKVIQLFQQYEWKGNVRELRNLVERLLIMCEGKLITENDLPEGMRNSEKKQSFSLSEMRLWKDFKAYSEKYFIEEKLKQYNYNIAKTAREIDLPRSNLYKKIEANGIIMPENSESEPDEEPLES